MTFARKTYERKRTVHVPMPEHLRRSASFARADTAAAPVEKDAPIRSEPYRRLVAALPCIVCGVVGYSQAAHPNTNKGAGTKTDDRECFPLCADRPGVLGCHPQFDQGAMFDKASRRIVEVDWAIDTRRTIDNRGLWPANLPKLSK
jgi:hypothetical protein